MKSWTIGKRIVFGFCSVLATTLALGSFAYLQLASIKRYSTSIAVDALPGMFLIGQIEKAVGDNQFFVMSHIVSDSREEMAAFEQALLESVARSDDLSKKYQGTITRAEDRELFDRMISTFAPVRKIGADVLALSRDQKPKEAFALSKAELLPAFKNASAAILKLVEFNRQIGEADGASIQKSVRRAETGLWLGSTLAILAGASIAFMIIRGTSRILTGVAESIGEGSGQISSASGQVSSASQSLAEGASEQAASLEETSSSLEEMASMTKRNHQSAVQVNGLAREARAAADGGTSEMEAMVRAMNEIKASGDETAKVVKTIDEIAFQTNILALNAAVEAARAGEAGMGFAVVADEVRSLAQRAAHAAKETSAMIENSLTKTTQGVEISVKVAESLKEIVGKVRRVDELAAEVASASKEQSQGIEQLNTAVVQMDKVTQSNAASAEETASAAEELNAQAQVLRESVGQLMRMVGAARVNHARQADSAPRTLAPAARARAKSLTTPPKVQKASNGDAAFGTSLQQATERRTAVLPLEESFKDF